MARSGTVVALRNARNIEAMAATVRRVLGIAPSARMPMNLILEHMLDLVFEDAYFEVLEDGRMGGAEARTSYHEPIITLSSSTYNRLRRGHPRARMTVAHEIGHLLMHCLRPVAMNTGQFDPRRDPEWQADMFAAALLMPRPAFLKMPCVEEAMKTFGVSWSAATGRAGRLGHKFPESFSKKGKKKAAPKRRLQKF